MWFKNYDDMQRLKEKIDNLDNKRIKVSIARSKNRYKKRIQNGEWSVYCMAYEQDMLDSWDDFEKETQPTKEEQTIEVDEDEEKEEMEKIGKRVNGGKMNDTITIRVYKGENSVEMSRGNIKTQEELEHAKEYLLYEIRNTLSKMPNELKEQKVVKPKEYAKGNASTTVYDKKDLYTKEDVKELTPVVTDNQAYRIVQKLNAKQLTEEQVRSIGLMEDGSYDRSKAWKDVNIMVFGKKEEDLK